MPTGTVTVPKDFSHHFLITQGTLELDYVTWKRGLEASFRLDLSNPCDLFIGEKLLQRAQVLNF